MKLIFLLCAVALVVADETYNPTNDDLDVEAVVASVDKLRSFNNCFLEQGTCDAVQGDFKKDIPEAVKESCAKCTVAQKHIFKRYLEGLKEKLPDEYQKLKTKYDPEDKYFKSLEEAIAKS